MPSDGRTMQNGGRLHTVRPELNVYGHTDRRTPLGRPATGAGRQPQPVRQMTATGVRTFLQTAIVLAVVSACGGEGHEIYMSAGCDECHGADLKGIPSSGPTLKSVNRHWDEDRLLVYFRDPDSVASSDPRLSELRDRFGEGMPPLKLADPLAREKLARYILR